MKLRFLNYVPLVAIAAVAMLTMLIAGPYGLFDDAKRIIDGLILAAGSNLLVAVCIGAVFMAFIYIRYMIPVTRALGEALSKSYVELLFTGGLMFMAIKAYTMQGAKGLTVEILMLYGALSLVFAGIFIEKFLHFTTLILTALRPEEADVKSKSNAKSSGQSRFAVVSGYSIALCSIVVFAVLILSRIFSFDADEASVIEITEEEPAQEIAQPEEYVARVEHVKSIEVAENEAEKDLGPADASALPTRLRFNWSSDEYGWQPAFVNMRPEGDFVVSGSRLEESEVSQSFALDGPSLTPNGSLQGKLYFHRRVLHELNSYYGHHPDHGARVIQVDRIPGGVRLRIPSDGNYPTQSFEVRAKI
ncbi:MAG: hypothetical protein AAGB46_15370 [Verrucomicrobiota bacterium]